MFSQLCRACLSHLHPGDNVSLFNVEPCQNIFYYRMCNALQLSVEESDKLPRNVCKTCAQEILKFYKFHLMYMESNRELRQMLGQSIRTTKETFEDSNLVDVVNELRDSENYADSGNDYDFHHTNILEIDVDENKANEMTFEYIKLEPISDHDEYNSELGLVLQQGDSKFNDSLVDRTGTFGVKIKVIPEAKYELQDPVVIKSENKTYVDVPLPNDRKFGWKCKTCFSSFKTRDLLREHRRTHWDPKRLTDPSPKWQCNFCLIAFSTRREYRDHRRNEHPQRVNYDIDCAEECVCAICNKTFSSIVNIRRHMQTHRDKESKKRLCNFCGSKLSSTSALRQHIRVFHDLVKSFHCTLCSKTFSNDYHHQANMNRHNDIKPFTCDLCHKSFYGKNVLRKHFKSAHLNYQSFICEICLKTFNRNDNLKRHTQRVHSTTNLNPIQLTDIPPERQCPFCLITFATHKKCTDHRRREHRYARKANIHIDRGEKCICEICDKKFSSKRKIRVHMETHRDKESKKRLCNICGLKYSSSSGLNKHVRVVHNRVKNFQCTLCSETFSYGNHLQSHMNRHKGIKPFTCDRCNKSFYGNRALHVHRRAIHLDYKSFACGICSKRFNQNCNLRGHMRRVHKL